MVALSALALFLHIHAHATTPFTTPTVYRDTLLFNDTIFYNIAYGNLAADEQAVQAAAMYVFSVSCDDVWRP